jgi:hypothetical protein
MRRGVAGFRAAALTRRVVRVTHDAWLRIVLASSST